MSTQWFVRRGEQEKKGPFSADQLKAAATSGKLLPDDLLWKEGLADWVPATKVKGLFGTTESVLPGSAAAAPLVTKNAASGNRASSPSAIDPQQQLTAQAMEDLFTKHLPAITAGTSSLFARGAIPHKKLDGVRQYREGATEQSVRLLFDSTVFGSASEGFALFDNGIAWRNSGSTTNGWKPFDNLDPRAIDFEVEPGMLGTKYLVLGAGGSNRIKCGVLEAATLERLVVLLSKATRVSRGTDPAFLRSKARLAASGSDFKTASIAWQRAAGDPEAVATEIIDEIRAAIHKYGAPAALTNLLEELCSKVADRSQHWSLWQAGQRFPRFVTASELIALWSRGQLFHDDRTRHFSEQEWYSAAKAEPLAALPRTFFRDTGHYEQKRYDAVVAAVRKTMGDAVPMFLAPLATDDADGLHWCVFEKEVVRVVATGAGEPVIDRLPIGGASVKLDAAPAKDEGFVTGQLRFGGDVYTVSLPQGPGCSALRDAWKRVALESAKGFVAQDRLFEGHRLLADAFTDDETDAEVEALRTACKPVVESLVDYHGGHPSFTEQCRGVLRFDEKGLEFVPVVFNSNGYMRIPYSDVVEVAPPVLGEVPEEIQSSHASKQAAGAALSIAAALLVGGQAGRAVGRSMGPNQAAVKPPKNRLGLSIRSDGTTYKLFFDVTGSDRDLIEKTAKDFWASAATVRGRFGKRSSPGRSQTRGVGLSAVAASGSTSSDVRDLLVLCLELQLAGDVATTLVHTKRFTPQQLEARRLAAIAKLASVLSDADTGGVKSKSLATPATLREATDEGDTGRGGSVVSRVVDEKPPTSPRRMSAAKAAAIGLGVGVVAAGVASAAMASGGSEETAGNDASSDAVLMDLDHDGRADAVGVDIDGDGDIDTVGVDRDGDGTVDAVAVDTDNDGRIDTVGTDTDGDGDIDAVAIDTDGDGEADALAMDTDNDGDADIAAIDDDGDGVVDAVAMDTDHDGSFDTLAVDEDNDHVMLATDDEAEEAIEEADYEDGDDAAQYADDDDAGFDFEV